MNKDIEIEVGPTIHDSIDSMRMFEAKRQAARDAMRAARLLVDGSLWVKDKIGQLSELAFLKPHAQP